MSVTITPAKQLKLEQTHVVSLNSIKNLDGKRVLVYFNETETPASFPLFDTSNATANQWLGWLGKLVASAGITEPITLDDGQRVTVNGTVKGFLSEGVDPDTGELNGYPQWVPCRWTPAN